MLWFEDEFWLWDPAPPPIDYKKEWIPCKFPELEFPCGHRNYGTPAKPASVHFDCAVCGEFYCESCNYDRHICYGCGGDLDHRSQTYHYEVDHSEEPIRYGYWSKIPN